MKYLFLLVLAPIAGYELSLPLFLAVLTAMTFTVIFWAKREQELRG